MAAGLIIAMIIIAVLVVSWWFAADESDYADPHYDPNNPDYNPFWNVK